MACGLRLRSVCVLQVWVCGMVQAVHTCSKQGEVFN